MGDFRVRPVKNATDKAKMYQHVLEDIRVFERLLAEGYIDEGMPKIGAEQEICLIDQLQAPASNALKILAEIEDKRYTNELALFNLEVNLDPIDLSGTCFSKMEQDLLKLLRLGQSVAAKKQNNFILTGILPTLKYRHLQFEYMTPIQRYQTLSKVLASIRGDDFQIYLQGVDDCIYALESVLFEACNTSFQLHLQIKPSEFTHKHNWSQMIAGPVLAACVNSPLLFGKELWAESRIAIFKQSLDTRSPKNHLRKKLARVYFGDDWLYDSPANLWKETVRRYPLLVTSDDFASSEAMLNSGKIPKLRAVQLHNGTTYTWNRLCFGRGGKQPHIRIECRYLPAGPSPIDEMANFAFWIGLMEAMPENWAAQWPKMDFRAVKDNFIRAARYGLSTVFNWFGKNYSAKELLLDILLPMAKKGLEKYEVAGADMAKYLGVMDKRIRQETNGAVWLVNNYRYLQKHTSKPTALNILTTETVNWQKANKPVHEWDNLIAKEKIFPFTTSQKSLVKVEEIMSTDLQTINEEDSLELALNLAEWQAIHHLPVENVKGQLVGILTDGLLQKYSKHPEPSTIFIKDIMIKEVISLKAEDSIYTAIATLGKHQLSGVPITYKEKLVGILTKNDIQVSALEKV